MSRYDLLSIASSGPKRYKVFEIKKRNGGLREIAQPARELKAIQRVLVAKLLDALPVHADAMAYRKGVSIRDNAVRHKTLNPILKIDFRDFFPSITSSDWEAYCNKSKFLEQEDIDLSVSYFFRRRKGEKTLRLSIGAPSSPLLSNILMFDFDEIISTHAASKGVAYTKYADDLTFSGQRIGMLKDMEVVVKEAIRMIEYPRLRINPEKTTYVTSSYRRTVTGLVLDNNTGSVGLGRTRKRAISATVHSASLGRLEAIEMRKLSGLLAFVNVAEPKFLETLARRYGLDVIERIKSSSSPASPI